MKTLPFKNPAGVDTTVQQLSEDGAKHLLRCIMEDQVFLKLQEEGTQEAKDLFRKSWEKHSSDLMLCQIIQKRIDFFKLRQKFTPLALFSVYAFEPHVPGVAVTFLIDTLNKYPINDLITVADVCEVYPFGFYTEESFTNYIDNYLKPRKVPHAEIY